MQHSGVIPAGHRCVLFVLGRYRADFQSQTDDLEPFLQQDLGALDWFVCAFGHQEQECALAARDCRPASGAQARQLLGVRNA